MVTVRGNGNRGNAVILDLSKRGRIVSRNEHVQPLPVSLHVTCIHLTGATSSMSRPRGP